MSGGIADYGSSDINYFFSEEAPPSSSGSGQSHYEPSPTFGGRFSDSPLAPPPTEAELNTSASYAIPAAVIILSIAGLFLMVGGLKLLAHIRQRRRKRENYMAYSREASTPHLESNTMMSSLPFITKPFLSSGYRACPAHSWSAAISGPAAPATRRDSAEMRQPSLREAVRIADALEGIRQETDLDIEMARQETMSVDSNDAVAKTTIVEVEVH